ncbi:TKL protein kinase [Capsaspora owczarzaki ATCC 30864]|uniref:TKL protein kinase n=1 Tax=Capsaspora owczarzaki (strain ATCC 30864) TaxID=595528 RepID=A0A0D2TZJ6_CAPO3|nr:TKL protein kinase [Capsaspora owczarzaki ATCC 30864]
MATKKFAFGLILALLLCVINHVHLAQAVNACGAGGVCTCSGTVVHCQSQSLTSIPSGIPADTTELDLNYNPITNIPSSAFTDLNALKHLYLQSSRITSIPADAFISLTALNTLALSGYWITTIPKNAFKDLTALQYLHLGGSRITSIPAGALTGLTALTQLDLDRNLITSISANAFTGLTALQYLNLQDNQITSIPSSAFSGLTGLIDLLLNANPFTTLPPGLFSGLPNDLCLSAGGLPYLSPNNFTFGGNAVAPPSMYGNASQPYPCDTACATCYVAGRSACCGINCLTCNSSSVCTQCYEGYIMMDGSCAAIPSALFAAAASTVSTSAASFMSIAVASVASVTSFIAQLGGGSQAAITAVATVATIAILELIRRRSQSAVARPNDSTFEAVQMSISPMTRSTRSQNDEDTTVGQNRPQPLHQTTSTTSAELIYANERAIVTGSASRRIRESLTIVKHLASGNFGDVALGQLPFNVLPPRAQNLLGPAASEIVQVAVKSLKSNANEQSRKDFEIEADSMTPFVHANVVRLLAALVESEPQLVLLELVQYGDLRTLLQKSKKQSFEWTHNEQIHVIRQIALGMEYLGTLNFVHRDLAARNCLVGQGMVVKVADFGLSRELEDEEKYYRMQTNRELPLKWMAPETMTGPKFSSMSDVWSFGVTVCTSKALS